MRVTPMGSKAGGRSADEPCMTDRRSNSRLKTYGLSTPYGEIIDISDSGLGVFRKGKLDLAIGDTVSVHISHDNTEIELTASVARINKVGLFRHEIGFVFVDPSEEMLTQVWALASSSASLYTCPRCWVAA